MSESRPELNHETRRQILYAALLRYTPDAGALRERVVDRLVLCALVGSSREHPKRRTAIRGAIQFGEFSPTIRLPLIEASIERLTQSGKISADNKPHPAYFLSSKGEEEIVAAIDQASRSFEGAFQNLLRDLDPTLPTPIAETIIRHFLAECFSRHGQRLAASLSGRSTMADVLHPIETAEAFERACSDHKLESGIRESLLVRCQSFFSSRDLVNLQLAEALSQNYYLSHLLGIQEGRFDPLAQYAFKDAVLYLDTNIILARYLVSSDGADLYVELMKVSRGLGIEMRVTTETIAEALRVIGDRGQRLAKVVTRVTPALLAKVSDPFLDAFLSARDDEPDLTPQAFVEKLGRVGVALQDAGIMITEPKVEALEASPDCPEVESVIQGCATSIRQWAKPKSTLRHDVLHCMMIAEVRAGRKKAWFLTRDRTLVAAACQLADDRSLPFAMLLPAFLESVSPFLEYCGVGEQARVFLTMVMSQDVKKLPMSGVMSLEDVAVLVEHHGDVLATPPDRLVAAVDYVKSNVLRGQPYSSAGTSVVALELRKFLISTAAEKELTLMNELSMVRQQSRDAEARLSDSTHNISTLKEALEASQRTARAQEGEISSAKLEASQARGALLESRLKTMRARCIVGMLVGAVVAVSAEYVAFRLVIDLDTDVNATGVAAQVAKAGGALLVVISGAYWGRAERWTSLWSVGAAGLLSAIGLWLAWFGAPLSAEKFSIFFAIATPVLSAFMIGARGRGGDGATSSR